MKQCKEDLQEETCRRLGSVSVQPPTPLQRSQTLLELIMNVFQCQIKGIPQRIFVLFSPNDRK